MTLMDYCMQYIDEIMDGRRSAPEGVTLTETDPVARGMELLQKVGDFPTLVRLCAAQDGTQIPQEVYDSFDPGAAISVFLGRDGEQKSPQEPTREQEEPQPDPDAGKHAFQVLLDCVALDDGLVQYLTQVLRDRDWAGFYKLSQITTKMDLDPEEFLFWLGNKELWADDEERVCAAVMDACLDRLRQEGRLELMAALLSGDRHTFESFRCEAPELVHLPQATYDWYCRNYLDRDYPFRMLLRCNGVTFPQRKEG